jgi:hypothetical protein
MPKARAIVAACALSLALSASAAALASAEETPHFIKGGKEIAEKLAAEGKIKSFFLRVPGEEIKILCEGIDNAVDIGPKWKTELDIDFTKCTVYNLAGVEIPNCKVKEPIEVDLLGQLVYKAGKKGEEIYDVFYGAEEKTFKGILFEISIEGAACAFAGEKPVVGSAIGLPTPKNPKEETEVLKVNFAGESMPSHEYVNLSNNKLETAGAMKLGGHPAFLEGEVTFELKPKAKFGAE